MKPVGGRSPLSKYASYALAAATLMVLVVPPARAIFYDFDYDLNPPERDYRECAAGLIGEGIAPEEAAQACGIALNPKNLADCVTGIDNEALTATAVLDACRRVRRPSEMAQCFNDISGIDSTSTAVNVLDNCRRSLLPQRFANCVVGLREEIDFSTDIAMDSCIAAGNRPRNVLPSFRPLSEQPQTDQ